MSEMWRATLTVFVLCLLGGIASMARGGDYGDYFANQAGAYAACVAPIAGKPAPVCTYVAMNPPTGGDGSCPDRTHSGRYDKHVDAWGDASYYWCVPLTCAVGDTPDGTTDHTYANFGMATGEHGRNGCCYQMHLSYAGKPAGGADSDGYAVGYVVGTGNRCVDSYGVNGEPSSATIPMPPILKPFTPCGGKASCYDPFGDQFCGSTDSGEMKCVPRKDPPPGGCISGATGATCVNKNGEPIPTPPDPPIKKDTAPSQTNNYTFNEGGTTNNYTSNTYSGTSSGGSGSESGPPGSSGSPGGSGTNSQGSGNSGKNGTDTNGKCSDGSVPTASGCSGTYRDDGCDTPPACHGDAVLCGIAANTHKAACNPASGSSVGDIPAGLDGDPTDNSGDPGSSAVSDSVDLGDSTGSLDSSGFGFATACPIHDVSFSVMGSTVNIPLADKCDLLSFLRYIVLALAYFAAAKIIAGVK